MKKITIISIALLSLAVVSCNDNASKKIDVSKLETAKERDEKIAGSSAVIEFDKTEFDFGTVTEGKVVEGTFVVKNVGKTDLLITDAKASCGCTVPEWPKGAIKPGETGDIKFAFDSS